MSSYLPQLLKMRSELDAIIAAIQSGSDVSTPSVTSATTPDAPKKRGRPRLSSEEKTAAKKAAKKAAEAIAAEGSEVKPKKLLSPEHLAKLKAGREAAKARKVAEAVAKAAAESASNLADDSSSNQSDSDSVSSHDSE